MEIIRGIVIVLHLVGFALLIGPWLVEALSRRMEITSLMQWGMALALVTGLALAAPWGVSGTPNYMKIGIKLIVLLIIAALLGIGAARQRSGKTAGIFFWPLSALVLANATIAVLV